MSFREIAVTVRAVNRASNEFSRIQTDAQALTARIKSLGSAVAGLGAAGMAVGYVAEQFGVLDAEQAKVVNGTMLVVSVMGTFMRTSVGVAVVQKVYAAACWVATAAQNALNISYATFLALTGVGVAVIVAAGAAMLQFASQMDAATSSVQNYNEAWTQTSGYSRNIIRSGDVEAFRRRGVE
ncbi:MAG: hypothetical protein NWF04_02025 [Candidatus Bathyarchaeota archaeon]|nr:hypothetical protein [Candidatus Bathyarchaeota archaeon]